MGSVLSACDCPRCKNEHCMAHTYYKTGEYSLFCMDCGYSEAEYCLKDSNGTPLLKDPSLGFVMNNLFYEKEQTDNPYGAYFIKHKGVFKIDECGNLTTKEAYQNFVHNIISETSDFIDNHIEEVTVSSWQNGAIKKEIVFSIVEAVRNLSACPLCKQPNPNINANFKTGEYSVNCFECGYSRSSHKVIDDEKKENNNNSNEEVHLKDPFGAYVMESLNGKKDFGIIKTEEEFKQFTQTIYSLTDNIEEHQMKEAIVSRIEDGVIKKITVFSNEVIDKHEANY